MRCKKKLLYCPKGSAALFYNGSRVDSYGIHRSSGSIDSYGVHNYGFGHFYDSGRISVFSVGCAVAASYETGSDGCYTGELEKFFHSGMS